ncbi:hypothetical protein [Klebsiella pneumoniae]|uniref:hypothetical protein n=1 Tax=Klebsiella pneumoniae TaxID=573 RepID=UPI001D197989|nr:hypothetical protein [Klebsiella pneumoniae]
MDGDLGFGQLPTIRKKTCFYSFEAGAAVSIVCLYRLPTLNYVMGRRSSGDVCYGMLSGYGALISETYLPRHATTKTYYFNIGPEIVGGFGPVLIGALPQCTLSIWRLPSVIDLCYRYYCHDIPYPGWVRNWINKPLYFTDNDNARMIYIMELRA